MGISIHTIIDPSCISKADWRRVYDETVTVLRAWPDAPLRPNYHHVAGTELVAYTRDVIGPDGWHICGDATTRRMGESIELPGALGVDDPRPPPADMPLRMVDPDDPPYQSGHFHWLLNNKTQGRPYHTLVLAVAMLIEHRLPHAALAGGDFTRDQAKEAQARLEPILGEVIPLPLAADPVRLHERPRPHLDDEALDAAMRELRCHGMLSGLIIGVLDGSFGSRAREEIESAVACTDVSTLDDDTKLAFDFLMAQAKALFGVPGRPGEPSEHVGFPAELAGLDAAQLLPVIIGGRMTRSHLRLTEMAWDEIQRASVDELRLLAMLATHPTVGLVGYQLCCAVFESVAVRQLCLQAWNTTPPIPPHEVAWEGRLFEEGQSDQAPSAEARS